MAEVKGMAELEEFVKKMDEAGDNEEAMKRIVDGVQSDSEELTEADLDNVAGGISEWGVLNWLISHTRLGKLTLRGVKVSARCIYDYFKYGDPYRTYSHDYVRSLGGDLENSIPNWIKQLG